MFVKYRVHSHMHEATLLYEIVQGYNHLLCCQVRGSRPLSITLKVVTLTMNVDIYHALYNCLKKEVRIIFKCFMVETEYCVMIL